MGELDWASKLYIENADLYTPVLENLQNEAEDEVRGLSLVFDANDIREGARVLDLSCGIGRHSIPLALRGYEVVGFDPSAHFIEIARFHAKEKKCDAKFYQGNIADYAEILVKNDEGTFNVIINMFQSFGYANIERDIDILCKALALTKKNGLLIIELENRDYWVKNFQNFIKQEFGTMQIHEAWRFDIETSTAHSDSKFYRKMDQSQLRLLLDLHIQLRLYSLHEFIEVAKKIGWNYTNSFGNLNPQRPVTFETQEMFIVLKNSKNSCI